MTWTNEGRRSWIGRFQSTGENARESSGSNDYGPLIKNPTALIESPRPRLKSARGRWARLWTVRCEMDGSRWCSTAHTTRQTGIPAVDLVLTAEIETLLKVQMFTGMWAVDLASNG